MIGKNFFGLCYKFVSGALQAQLSILGWRSKRWYYDCMERNVFGAPRPLWHLDPDAVDAPNMFRGSDVEHAVASSLNLLTHEFPGAKVFHSASLEEDGNNEVDSVLVYKKFVFLVEAKSASPGTRMSFSAAGRLRRGTAKQARTFPYNKNRLGNKVQVFANKFPDLHVRGMFVFSGSGSIALDSYGDKFLLSFEEMLPFIRARMSPAKSLKLSSAEKEQVEEMSALLLASQTRYNLTKHARRVLQENPVLAFGPPAVSSAPAGGFWGKLRATYLLWSSN